MDIGVLQSTEQSLSESFSVTMLVGEAFNDYRFVWEFRVCW